MRSTALRGLLWGELTPSQPDPIQKSRNFKICFTIFNLHLHRFPFPLKAVTHCNSCTNYRGQSVDLVIHCVCIIYSAATVPSYVILISFLAVPEETRSNILECLSEHRRGRHDEALTSMYHELACIAREMEPFVLEPGKFLLAKLMESDRKIELLFKKIEFDSTLEGFSIEVRQLMPLTRLQLFVPGLLNIIFLFFFFFVLYSFIAQITEVLRKYTAILEEISFFLSADVYRFMNDEAMMINRALLANQRAIAKLFFNLMKSELKTELSHRLKWQDRVRDWKFIQKNYVVHSFREFMANEEIQNPPTVKTEMENMITDQILLSERRLEHHWDILSVLRLSTGPLSFFHFTVHCEIQKSLPWSVLPCLSDTHNVQCMMKIRIQYEMVQQKCLAEVQLCKVSIIALRILGRIVGNSTQCVVTRDFEELAKQNEQNCRNLYSYFKEAMGLWDVHQLKLSQQEGELQKKLDECRWKQDNSIQVMEANLDIILDKMRTASSEEKLKEYLENTDLKFDRYETFNQVLMDKVMAYPEAILWELLSYSISISQYFNVKEIFKQQQAESIVQENEGEEETDCCQQENEETNTAENEKTFAQETEETEEKEDGKSTPHESEETEHAEQRVSFTQVSEQENKFEGEGSLKWFAESLPNSCAFVAAKKEKLNSELQLRLHLHQQRQENIATHIYNVRAVELLLHKERLECHCAGVVEALKKERAEFLKFCDQQNNISKNLHSRIRDIESVFLSAPMTEKLVSFSNSLHSELHNHLEVIQVSLRSYRNYLEEALGKLRDSNVDFLKACRLFLEGGNFSPEEVKYFSKRLQEESKRIDSFESLIKTDMQKMESSYLEQATELINQSETKFRYLFMNRVFVEKIQRFLTNLQVQIKSEVQTETSELLNRVSFFFQFQEDFTPLATDVTFQGPIAVAIRTECLRDENKVMVMGLDPVKFPLLNPSRMGKSAVDDLSISVIKNLLDISESEEENWSQIRGWLVALCIPANVICLDVTCLNVLSTTFLFYLYLLKEFYQKENPQITMLEDLPETFEHCAEVLRQNLLSYQRQTDDYYNSCLTGKFIQLRLSISCVCNFSTVHKNQLHPSLGHPDNLLQLDTLCQEEIKRQKDQADGIHLNTQMLQDCAVECAQNFFAALAALTEKLLLELDESITIDDVQLAKIEIPRQKTSTLIRRKQAGLPLEISEVKQLIERGSRTWPGIPMTTLTDNSDCILCRETASVTTAKTTLGHVAAVEERDAVYKVGLWREL
uniref:Coiled-coil domain containing 180 n=1 Tax=Aquila chrysaetos chrysaetos TaxID=223781 RepID=A0A663F8L2_AQUCH